MDVIRFQKPFSSTVVDLQSEVDYREDIFNPEEIFRQSPLGVKALGRYYQSAWRSIESGNERRGGK